LGHSDNGTKNILDCLCLLLESNGTLSIHQNIQFGFRQNVQYQIGAITFLRFGLPPNRGGS